MDAYTLDEQELMDQLDIFIGGSWSPYDLELGADQKDAVIDHETSHVATTKPSASLRKLAPAPVAQGNYARAPMPTRRPAPPEPAPLREQDRLLPMTNVARLMAAELPPDAKISKDAKVLMQELVTEFICFVTSEANDFSIANKRKAISVEDTMSAFESVGEHI